MLSNTKMSIKVFNCLECLFFLDAFRQFMLHYWYFVIIYKIDKIKEIKSLIKKNLIIKICLELQEIPVHNSDIFLSKPSKKLDHNETDGLVIGAREEGNLTATAPPLLTQEEAIPVDPGFEGEQLGNENGNIFE